ncbi:MAG TPA: hypothetical protein VGO93_18670 [Candidatus Xenobia bacterium]|jgi:hypothetical protein
MDLEKFVTILATLVGAFWVLLQIITHVHEKGHRNILTALVLMVMGAVPVIFFMWQPRAVQPAPVHVAPASSPTPSRSESPTPSPSPSPAASASRNPSATLQASFQVSLTHNLVGGLSQVLLQCTFENAGPAPQTVTGYTINIHAQGRREHEAQDHVFDRVLPAPITVLADGPQQQNLPMDAEIGDLLVTYRKSPAGAWVHVTWHGHGPDARPFDVTSSNNGSP